MSVDYRGALNSGLLSRVTSNVDGQRYNVSSAITSQAAGGCKFETAVFKRGLLGSFRPLIKVASQGDVQAKWVHYRVEEIAERRSRDDWGEACDALFDPAPGDSTAAA
jgi:hypothetical protein